MSRVLVISFHPDTFHCEHAILHLRRIRRKAGKSYQFLTQLIAPESLHAINLAAPDFPELVEWFIRKFYGNAAAT